MTIDAGEVFNDLIAEYSTAQKLREQADFPRRTVWGCSL